MKYCQVSNENIWRRSFPSGAPSVLLLSFLLAGCQTEETSPIRSPKPNPTPKETKAPAPRQVPPAPVQFMPAGNYLYIMRNQEASGTREGPNNSIIPAYQMELSVPEFLGPQFAKLNTIIIDFAGQVRTDFIEDNARQSRSNNNLPPWQLKITSTVEFASPQWASIRFDKSEFFGTGATNQDVITLNFQANPPAEQGIQDVLQSKDKIKELSSITTKLLQTRLAAQTDPDWLLKGAGPFEENYQNFTFGKAGVTLYFYPGQVCSETLGCQTVILPPPIAINLFKPEILTMIRSSQKAESN